MDLQTSEYQVRADNIAQAMQNDLNIFAAICMPEVFKFEFPQVFLAVWNWLVENVERPREFPQLALGWPRGFSKTTLMKLFIIYCILFTSKKFILVIGSTATLAENILSDIEDMLNEPNIQKIFGDWRIGIEVNNRTTKVFSYRGRTITLWAIGAGGSVRGINLKNSRPDVILFDDIQTREDANSRTVSESLETWMYGTAMKLKSPFGCTFLFVANMYPTEFSILKKLKKNPNWIKFIAGGILEDGTSLWEDLHPIAQLHKEYLNDYHSGHPEIFYSEVLNDENANMTNIIDFSLLPPIPELGMHSGNFIIIDPSGNKHNSDATAIGYFEVHNSKPVLVQVISKNLSPAETIWEATNLALSKSCHLIAIESVAYQASLQFWFKQVYEQRGLQGIEAVEIYPGGKAKNSRILEMMRSYAAGELFITPEAKPAAHFQMMRFNPLKTDNQDDILDLLWYSHKVIELYGAFIVNTSIIETQKFNRSKVYKVHENCIF